MYRAYQFKLSLIDGDEPIWRRFVIPAETNFKRLHDAIQLVMWWDDEHLAKFEDDLREPTFRFVLFPDEVYDHKEHLAYLKSKSELSEFERLMLSRLQRVKVRHMKNVKLPTIIEKHPVLYYTYDYGEDWTHELSFEGVIEDYPNPYPTVTEWVGETPHEGVGGWEGNQMIRDILADPTHPEHEEYKEASKGVQAYDIDKINHMLEVYVTVKK
ncbi:plasmid pRiA4b ORF-3 family protein [Exiguobacterium sp. s196]|uniref:plasmid pRiA4b ORF-3 family protein n=1 Tax=Exiguobacterium sp. s196 TaxID=2751283 RepID=UPI0025520DA5|nr:plasmid pRiA4b ORF-3 family protein [Exiguobacterium sp. s196]